MNVSYNRAIEDLVDLSTVNFDRENILAESEYFGSTYQQIARDVLEQLSNKPQNDPGLQERINNLINWIK